MSISPAPGRKGDKPALRGLGRGLSALLGDEPGTPSGGTANVQNRMIPIEQLGPSPYQPRRHFAEDALHSLVESIRAQGILQPLVVRRSSLTAGRFEIVAGERRWRAAQRVPLHELPVIIRDISDSDTLQIALIENIQRQDLSPLEEAEAYRRLIDEFSHTQEELATALGKSRSHIANTLRLLTLPGPVRAMVGEGTLSAGHARALMTAADPTALADEIVRRGLSVREAERLAAAEKPATTRLKNPPQSEGKAGHLAARAVNDGDAEALAADLSEQLGLKVIIQQRGSAGALTVIYQTLDQLDDLAARLSHPAGNVGR